jgi:hypothetical protein
VQCTLTRMSSATAGGSELRLQWNCFHNLEQSTGTAGGTLKRFG